MTVLTKLGRCSSSSWLGPLAAAAPALLLLGVLLHYYGDFVSDDAYISFRYAEHLATGKGLEWNPGYRVEGYSNFLWVALAALLRLFALPVPLAAQVLARTAAALTVIVIVLGAWREARRPALGLLILSPLPLVLSFPYQYWTAMRLETTLFALLLLAAPLLFAVEEERHRGGRWASALCYLALALTRPEGAAFIAIPGLYLLARLRSLGQLRLLLRERGLWLGVFVVGYGLYTLWRLLYFGDLLPNTYYAKVSGTDELDKGWTYLTRFLDARPLPLILAAAVLLLRGTRRPPVMLLLTTALTLAGIVVLEGGDWMAEYRLLIPTLPLLVAALALTLQHRFAEQPARQRLAPLAGLLLICLFVQGHSGTPLDEWSAAWSGKRRDLLINLEGELTVASARAGRWLAERARPGDLVAVNHAGAVPFYAGLPALDMTGLNDRHIARLPGGRHGKWDPDYVLAQQPAFIVLNTRTRPTPDRFVTDYWPGETALYRHPDFQRHYRQVTPCWSWRHRPLAMRSAGFIGTAYIVIFERIS